MSGASDDRPPDEPAPRARRRSFQFSLRTLLVAVTLAAGGLLAWRTYAEPYRRQRDTMQLIEKLGGTYIAAEAPGWMRRLAGSDFQNVTSVNVADLDQPDAFMEAVSALPELRTLAVGGVEFGDEHLQRLHRLTRLTGLVLDSTSVSEDGLAALRAAVPQVEVCRSDRRAIAAAAERHGQLLDVAEEWGPAPPPWAQVFPEELFVRGWSVDMRYMVTIGDLKFLRGFSGTRVLDLGFTRVTNADLAEIEPLRQLTYLDLAHTAIDDQGLAHLRRLTRLKSLHLTATKVSDAGLERIGEFTDLEVLDLGFTGITDAAAERIAGLPRLRELNVGRTKVTDTGLARLTKLTNLRWLHLVGCRATREGVERFQRALPRCNIGY